MDKPPAYVIEVSFYGTDLAHIHHVGFSGLSRAVGPWLVDQLAKRGRPKGLVVDLGCGTGVLAAQLSRRGYEVLGVDRSSAMVALARRTAPAAQFVVESLFRTPLPPCQAVTAIGEALNYRDTDSRGVPRLRALFRRVHRALEPGGIFVFDIIEGPVTPRLAPSRRHWQGRDWAILIEVDQPRLADRLDRRITIFRRRGTSYRRSQETHSVYLYPGGRVDRELREAGFRVRRLRRYGITKLLPSRLGFLASKP